MPASPSSAAEPLDLPVIEVQGTPRQLGHGHGEAARAMIAAFVAQRERAAAVYLRERGIRDGAALLAIGGRCLQALADWDPSGHAEHLAVAEAAGVDAVALYTAANMTDIRDVLALPGPTPADREGCTMTLVPASAAAGGEVIAAQSWDLNPGDLPYVVAVHRRPQDAPASWSITCSGCPTLIGMNAAGLAIGTTNIKVRGSRVGIPYLSILHRAMRETTRRAAGAIFAAAPRAAAHTYWAADPEGAGDWECTPDQVSAREAVRQPLVRTNHCLDERHRPGEGEPPSSSSLQRLAIAQERLAAQGATVESLQALFADRSRGVDSINRYAEDGQGTSTNAVMIAIPARRLLYACRGSSDRGRWRQLAFDGPVPAA